MPADPSGPPRDLRHPQAALLHPLWLIALALLVLNDHWFKGTGAAPLIAGKLSDFAGLLVAPFLLAAIVRARSQRAILACHVAVGLVFAGLQLWPAFSAWWSSVMALTGFDWATVSDPTDLMALPMLWVSARVLGRASRTRPRNIALQVTLAGVGLICCMATSPTYPRCENDDYCREKGEYCLHRRCEECRDDEHCAGAMTCQSGKCGYPQGYCDDTRRCPEGHRCLNHQCVAPQALHQACDEMMACADGYTCMARSCVKVDPGPTR